MKNPTPRRSVNPAIDAMPVKKSPAPRRYGRKVGFSLVAFILAASLLQMAALPGLAKLQKAFAAQPAGNLVAVGYSLTDESGESVAEIHKGNIVNVTVHMKSPVLTTDQVKPENVDVTKLADSFSASAAKVTVTSTGAEPLTYDVALTGLVYSGVGKEMRIMGGVKGDPASYETERIEIREAVVFEEPKPADPAPQVVIMPAETTAADSPASLSAGATSGSEGSSGISAPAVNPDSPVPYVIIDRYSYGNGPVAAGSGFVLGFDFRNTGKLNIENVVVSIDGGESFTMNNSTNTFFYDSLPAGATKSQDVPLQAVANAKSGAQSVGATFKYEYVDGGKRSSVTSEIKLSVPVSLPDRFQITAPIVPTGITAGSEVALTLPYVNKGKGEVSNVEATIEGDGIETVAKTQYIGNIAAGGSGSIGFALTPKKEGSTKAVLKVSYEDSNLQVRTVEFPVTFEVAKAPATDDTSLADVEEEQAGISPWAWVALPVLVGAGIVVVTALRRRKKKAIEAATQGQSWYEWDEEPSGIEAGSALSAAAYPASCDESNIDETDGKPSVDKE